MLVKNNKCWYNINLKIYDSVVNIKIKNNKK